MRGWTVAAVLLGFYSIGTSVLLFKQQSNCARATAEAAPQPSAPAPTFAPTPVPSDPPVQAATPPAAVPAAVTPNSAGAGESAESSATHLRPMQVYALESRISSIGRFVPITDEQRERLRRKFAAEMTGAGGSAEPLDDILGASNASFYREQLRSAFERSKEQSLDREIFYLARRLALSSEQEARLRQSLRTLESDVEREFGSEKGRAADPAARVKLMIRENDYRARRLAELTREYLAPEQYQAFLQEQAESSAQELGIWHAPG